MNIYVSIPINDKGNSFATEKAMAELSKVGTVKRNMTDADLNADQLVKEAYDADVIVCTWGSLMFTKEVIDRLPNLKMIAYGGGSMANTVDEYAYQRGIKVLTGNYIFAMSVAEGCLAYTMCALRELERYMRQVREGGWNENWTNRGLFGKRIGIVGFGEIAKNFVGMLKPFDMEILINSGHMTQEEAAKYGARTASREEIFETCDIVSLHISLNEKTKGCINRELLEKLQPHALLVNTARGEVVDEEALEELLAQKRFYAALDVFGQEPLPVDSRLRKLPNAMLIPHLGGPTIDMREYIICSLAKDIKAFGEGKPLKNEIGVEAVSRMSKKLG
ncbi:MAG: hydroxyacid dehydrogenase [Clostridia bacterium]|nr:hydroxyacid dehydrogenase [Clostridia bacterium]